MTIRSLRFQLLALGATLTAVAPAPARGQCNDMYANGVRPVATGPVPPPLAPANTQVLCRQNQWNVPQFGNNNDGYFESNYNLFMAVPNYVAYCLDPARSGRLAGQFWNNANNTAFTGYNADPAVAPAKQPSREFVRTSSVLQFGHMAPVASMKQALDAASQANYLTNGAPMVQGLNLGPWSVLETRVRTWARTKPVYVLVGPIYANMNNPKRLGAGAGGAPVALPDSFFAIVYLPSLAGGTAPDLFVYQFPNNSQIKKRPSAPPPPGLGPPELWQWELPLPNNLTAVQMATGFTFNLPALPNMGVALGPACGAPIN